MLATSNFSNSSIDSYAPARTGGNSSSKGSDGLDDDNLKQLLHTIEQILMMLLQNRQEQSQSDDGGDDSGGPAPASRAKASPATAAQAPGPAQAPAAAPQDLGAQGSPSQAAPAGGQQPSQQQAAATPTSPAAPTASAASVQPADGSGGDLSPQQIATKFGKEIDSASKETGVPPGIIAGQIWQESKGKPETPGGGLMQMGENEFKQYGGGDISNPGDNINAGARYIKDLADKFGGDMKAGLRAYNSGPNGVDVNNLDSTPAGTGDPTYVGKVMQAAEQSGLSTTQA